MSDDQTTEAARPKEVKDVCFAKKRGLEETDMSRSEYDVYHRLRCFRAGIEFGISWLKRCMGLTRCTWKGWEAFKSYVWSSIVAAQCSDPCQGQAGAFVKDRPGKEQFLML